MKKIILLICLIFLFFMAIENWGALQKSATDDETIEQAIARLIAVHEADPTSHLGVGESLQAHKVADVIDHPVGSVKNDKSSLNNFYYDLKFADYSTWNKYKASSAYSFVQYLTGIYFETYPSTFAGYNRLYKHFFNSPAVLSSYFISVSILSENTPHSSVYWSFGLFDSSLAVNRVSGFKFTGGKLYCVLWKGSTSSTMSHELVGVNIFDNVEHNLRFYYDVTLKMYTWYIDGVQVYQYDNTANAFPSYFLPSIFGVDFNFTYDADYDFVLDNYDFIMSVDSTY